MNPDNGGPGTTPDCPMQVRAPDRRMKNYFSWRKGEAFPLQDLYISPTATCTLRCSYCVHDVKHYKDDNYGNDISAEEMIRIIREAVAMGVQRFNIAGGGEPLLKTELCLAMMRIIRGAGANGSLTTNGMAAGAAVLSAIVEMGWNTLIFSIDSTEEGMADSLRGKGVFSSCVRAMDSVRGLKLKCRTPYPEIGINMAITSRNLTEMASMVHFAVAHGVQQVMFIPITAHSEEAEALKVPSARSSEFLASLKGAKAAAAQLGVRTNCGDLENVRVATETGHMADVLNHPYGKANLADSRNSILKAFLARFSRGKIGKSRVPPEDESSLENEKLPLCFEPWSTLVVHPDGSINPCQHNAKASALGERPLAEAWSSDSYLESLRRLHSERRLPDFCQKCCSVIVAAELGSKRAVVLPAHPGKEGAFDD